MAPIVKELEASASLQSFVTVTGQHRAMLDQVNMLFGIVPDHDLNIFQPGQGLLGILTRTLDGLDKLFTVNRPRVVLVQGDTTTSMAAALAAFNHAIPVVHVEAGLRSGNPWSPYPEEGNRKLISQIASLHLAPTEASRRNLLRENVADKSIVVTGNTVIDALLDAVEKPIPFRDPALEQLASSGRRILLVTTHRRENQGDAMRGVGRALARLATRIPDLAIVLPAHANPVVREALLPALSGFPNVLVTDPLPYGEFCRLLSLSYLALTDSGGIQEEAPSLGVPVLVLRENTERPEAVAAGTARLVGTNEGRIEAEVAALLDDQHQYRQMAGSTNPYGDGRAARRSVEAVQRLVEDISG